MGFQNPDEVLNNEVTTQLDELNKTISTLRADLAAAQAANDEKDKRQLSLVNQLQVLQRQQSDPAPQASPGPATPSGK